MKYFLSLSLLFITSLLHAQGSWCGYTEFIEDQNFENYVQSLKNASNKKSSKYIIPTVVHVIHADGEENVSYSEVENLINTTNDYLSLSHRDTNNIRSIFRSVATSVDIELRLATIDPDGNCTNGVNRVFSNLTNDARDNVKELIRWDNKKYLNIWVVKSIENTNSSEGTVLGFAYFPFTASFNPGVDGVVMRYDVFDDNTLAHELGHYLNLYHTFQGGCSGSGDRVDDTPPVASQNFGCPKTVNSCNSGSDDMIDQIENHMDYSSCAGMFTIGQKERMHAAIETYRSNLVSEQNLIATGVSENLVPTKPIAGISFDKKIICVNENLKVTSGGCSNDADTKYKWRISHSNIEDNTSRETEVSFNQAGLQDITLIIQNSKGIDSITIKEAVLVIDALETNKAPINFDFEANSPQALLNDGPEDFYWETSREFGYRSNSSIWINNFKNTKTGKVGIAYLPIVNIEDIDDYTLRYHYAYAQKNTSSADLFKIYISVDCGKNWLLRKIVRSSNLITTDETNTAFTPKDEENWREDETDISIFKSYSEILVKFEFESNSGNNLYLDNVRIGTKEYQSINTPINSTVKIFPIPASQYISLTLDENYTNLRIKTLDGKEIYNQKTDKLTELQINCSEWPNGLYIAELETNYGVETYKIIVNK